MDQELTLAVAAAFGSALDKDDFKAAALLLADDCLYYIGTEKLEGPEAICASYESNMLEGRVKFDKLEWGESRVEAIDDESCYVHFTDYLGHKGQEYTHRCKQRIQLNESGLIWQIEHIHDKAEHERLQNFYRSVGLK